MVIVSSTELDSILNTLREKIQSRKATLTKIEDKGIRNLFCQTIVETLRERFGIDKKGAEKYVYVEKYFGKIWRREGGTLFGAGLYPDSIIRFDDGLTVAVELDWGDKRRRGRLKNALSKAGMLKLGGDFYRVVLFFFIEEFKPTEVDQKALKFYQEHLSTQLILSDPTRHCLNV